MGKTRRHQTSSLYRELMRYGVGDELAAGCIESDVL